MDGLGLGFPNLWTKIRDFLAEKWGGEGEGILCFRRGKIPKKIIILLKFCFKKVNLNGEKNTKNPTRALREGRAGNPG